MQVQRDAKGIRGESCRAYQQSREDSEPFQDSAPGKHGVPLCFHLSCLAKGKEVLLPILGVRRV